MPSCSLFKPWEKNFIWFPSANYMVNRMSNLFSVEKKEKRKNIHRSSNSKIPSMKYQFSLNYFQWHFSINIIQFLIAQKGL